MPNLRLGQEVVGHVVAHLLRELPKAIRGLDDLIEKGGQLLHPRPLSKQSPNRRTV